MPSDQLADLARDLRALLDDMRNEQAINGRKLQSVAPGAYPYGEGMHDGLGYAAAGLETILERHGLLEPGV